MVDFKELKTALGMDGIDATIDFTTIGDDHEWARQHGYEPRMNPDCTCDATKNGHSVFPLSSYGDWFGLIEDFVPQEGVDAIMQMFEEGIIGVWRISGWKDGKSCFYYNTNKKTPYTIDNFKNGKTLKLK